MYAGRTLNREMAMEARKHEIEFFRKMGVHTQVDRNNAYSRIIIHKWLDTDKGDEKSLKYRSR